MADVFSAVPRMTTSASLITLGLSLHNAATWTMGVTLYKIHLKIHLYHTTLC